MSRRWSLLLPAMLVGLPMLFAEYRRPAPPQIRPAIPLADRNAPGRIFLEHADELRKATADSFMVLVGDVEFTKGGMTMRCDSAHYFTDTESLRAFGNVSMEQGDTLFVYADELDFDGPADVATLYADPGKKVRLINRDVTLETDVFTYDLGIDLGYYEVGGRLFDQKNTLTSLKGEYVPSTKEANFYTNVHLNSQDEKDTLNIYSDTLYYNTGTHVAELLSPSEVYNIRGTIFTTSGVYDTDSGRVTLYERSTVMTKEGQTLVADTIFYDRNIGYGEAFGAMVLTDTAKNVNVYGNYGYYNELSDSSFITGRAMLTQCSDTDTLYLHGRYIETFRVFDTTEVAADTIAGTPAFSRVDTTHAAVIFPRVRFYRTDMQGICDSMRFTEKDSMLRMFVHPVVWNADQQIFGKVIELHFNDSTVETARLPEQGFAASHIEGDHYNQLSGKEMFAQFVAGELRRLDVSGNVEIIMYPQENDSTFNKMVSAESSFLTAWFKGRVTERIKLWPKTEGVTTPLFLARKSMFYLPKFKWFGSMRPLNKDDIFVIPKEMEDLMAGTVSPDTGKPAAVRQTSVP